MRFLFLLILAGCTQLHIENDIFAPGPNDDKNYTHGTKFSHIEEKEDGRNLYSVGQNVYTPDNKGEGPITEEILDDFKRDRLYSGWLYGEYRQTRYSNTNNFSTKGIQIGCVGRCSFAQLSQQGVHKILGQKIPAWRDEFQQRSEPGVILEYELGKIFKKGEYYDFTGGLKFKGGNIITDGSGGFSFRAGTGLDKVYGEPIIFRVPSIPEIETRSGFSIFAFLEGQTRGVLYNHLLSGSLFQSERHRVSEEPFIAEGRTGFAVGYGKLRFTYTFFALTNEWKERKGGFAFGGLDFSWG